MAIIKCKMCGGDLQVIEGSTVCECEYCGTKQTVPTLDNEKKHTLFNRASRLLRNCEFDKAYGVFENIVAEFPEEAEAYWGLLLCRYGIEYVDDPATGEKIPTCHRTVLSSILDDSDFDMACENADGVAKRLYREEAKAIDRIQQGILKIVEDEEPYDVFICYKELDDNGNRTEDSVLAQEIYDSLTAKGLKTFFARITLENKLGEEYEPYIYAALHSAKVMLAVGTSFEHFDAIWVKNEWLRFLNMMKTDTSKKLIPCFKGIDAYDMPREFKNFLAQDLGKLGWQQDLTRGVLKICGKDGTKEVVKNNAADSGITALSAQTEAMLKRGYIMLEDGNYAKADDFFEKVLNNDAECGQAYWGKALAAAKVPNAEKFGSETLFSRLKKQAENQTGTVSTGFIAELARKADGTGLLKVFTDQELTELLSDLTNAAVQSQSTKQYYQSQEKLYIDAGSLHKLANSRDYDRSAQYADAMVTEAEQTILKSFRKRVAEAIAAEESRIEQIVDIIRQRLSGVAKEVENQHKAVEAALQEAEWKAEKDFQEATAKFEQDYRLAVSAQENEYQRAVTEWQEKKADYDQNHAAAEKKSIELNKKIRQMQAELRNLSGLFSGKRRRELEGNIALLKKKLEETYVPQDPGSKPEKPTTLQKGEAPKKEDYLVAHSGVVYDFKEQIKCSLSPQYKAYCENIEKMKGATLGQEIQFGFYPSRQGGTKKPISWKVLAREKNRLLVISRDGIECKPYHSTLDTSITWEKCDLRKWLNDGFLNTAFIAKERIMIPVVSVSAEKNPYYNTDLGATTQDRVFLINSIEAEQYFPSFEDRKCKPTEYATDKGCYVDSGFCGWFLRPSDRFSDKPSLVDCDGTICYNVSYEDDDGNPVIIDDIAVRPALWINLES